MFRILSLFALASVVLAEPEVHEVVLKLDPAKGTFSSEENVGGKVERFEGAFRDGLLRGGFYEAGDGPVRFRVTVTVPAPYLGVATGRKVGENTYECEGTEVQAAAVQGRTLPYETPAGFTTLRGPAFRTANAARAYALFLDRAHDVAFRKAVARQMSLGQGQSYERGAMLLHMRAREMGRAKFHAAVRKLDAPRVEWEDLVAAIGVDLPYVPPVLRFGAIHVQENRITGTIVGATRRTVVIPVRVNGTEENLVVCAARESVFSFGTKAHARLLELDPDRHVLRKTPQPELAPGLDLGGAGAPQTTMTRELRRRYPTFKLVEGGFEFGGEEYDTTRDGVLLVCRTAAFVHGKTGELPRQDSWAVFRDGKIIERGMLPGDRGARAIISPARRTEPEALLRDLLWLADPVHQGRRAGGMPAYKLANELRGRMFRAGLKVLPWPAVVVPEGHASKDRSIVLSDGIRLEKPFFPFHLSGHPDKPVKFERVVVHPAEGVKGALVLLPESGADARAYAERGAAAVAVASSDAAFTALGLTAVWVGAVPPSVKTNDVALTVSRAMAQTRGERLKIPYFYAHPDLAARLREHGKGGDVDFRIKIAQRQTSNIIGVFGDPRRPGILLSARWDGSGNGAPGAAAAAIVLTVAERLKLDHDAGRLKRPVVVALFGGEVPGGWGSRQFRDALEVKECPLTPPSEEVRIDAVGPDRLAEVDVGTMRRRANDAYRKMRALATK